MTTSTTLGEKTQHQFTDSDLCCVLHGYGKVLSNISHYIDEVKFTGGRAVNVPWSIAKFWVSNTRSDGKIPHGRVSVIVLPNDSTEAECMAAVGLTAADMRALGRQPFDDLSPQALIDHLGLQKARDLAAALDHALGNRRY